MKILWISHFMLYPDTGYGALQRSRGLLLELSKRHEVYLVSFYRDVDLLLKSDLQYAQNNLEEYCKKVFFIHCDFHNKIKKISDAAKSLMTDLPYSVRLYQSEDLGDKILDFISTYDIDLIHSDTIGLTENVLNRINSKIVKVLNHHNIESDMMMRRMSNEHNFLKRFFLRNECLKLQNYEKQFCPRYDMNLVVSDIDKQRLNEITGKVETTTIENGVNCEYFAHYPRSDENDGLIFTGSLDWYPNADAMIFFCEQVWPHLKKYYPNISLTILGKNPSGHLRRIVSNDNNIHLIGHVQDVRPYVRKARIFVCPIRDGGGTRLKILDALSQGIPIVSTEIGCEGINLKHGEHVLFANTPEDFLKNISALLSDLTLANKLSEHGRRFVEEHYSFDLIGSRLSSLYENLISGRKSLQKCAEFVAG
ncbi:MAG: glycosyltransferase family 4 protein [Thermodesulfovibrionales bacterium]